jgi:hypothetical protein
MQTNLQRVSTDAQENASGVIRIWQFGKQFLNKHVQRTATGRNNRLLTAITIASALTIVASYPAQAQNSFINLVNSNKKCLQPINKSTTPGDAMVLLPCDPQNLSQVWIVQTGSSGKVHFVNYSSKLCLDARGGAAAGTPIQQWTCNSITNENWLAGISGGALVSAVSGTSNYCVIPTGDQDGAKLQLIPCSTSIYAGELWNFPAVPDPNPPPGGGCVQSKSHPCP